MAATASIDAIEWLRKQIAEAAPEARRLVSTGPDDATYTILLTLVCHDGSSLRSDLDQRELGRDLRRKHAKESDVRVGRETVPLPDRRRQVLAHRVAQQPHE